MSSVLWGGEIVALLVRALANEYEQKGFHSGTAAWASVAMGSSNTVVEERCAALDASFSARGFRHPAWGCCPLFTGKRVAHMGHCRL